MSAVTHGSAGGTETLVATPSATTVANKGLTAGTGVSLSSSASAVTITNSDPASGVTLTSAGGTETLVNDGTGPALANKGLTAGTGISLSGAATAVTITNSDPASGVTLTSAGGTETLVNDGTGPALATKGLTAGTGISLSGAATAVTITNSDTGSAVTLSNAGTTTLVNDGVGPALATKGLVAGSNISFSTSSTDVTITGSQYQTGQQVCILRKSTNTAFTTGTSANLTWDVEENDPAGMHSTSMNTDRINILENGIYIINASIYATGGASTAICALSIYQFKNADSTNYLIGSAFSPPAAVGIRLNANRTIALSQNDYLYCFFLNNTALTQTIISTATDATFLHTPVFSVIKIQETP